MAIEKREEASKTKQTFLQFFEYQLSVDLAFIP